MLGLEYSVIEPFSICQMEESGHRAAERKKADENACRLSIMLQMNTLTPVAPNPSIHPYHAIRTSRHGQVRGSLHASPSTYQTSKRNAGSGTPRPAASLTTVPCTANVAVAVKLLIVCAGRSSESSRNCLFTPAPGSSYLSVGARSTRVPMEEVRIRVCRSNSTDLPGRGYRAFNVLVALTASARPPTAQRRPDKLDVCAPHRMN